MKVVKITEADVAEKIDTAYILEQFRHIERVGITFICTKDDRDVEDWTDEDGKHIVIKLPYKQVKRLKDIRPLMRAKARERLGLPA